MARRRFRSNQRHEPVTERSFQEYLYSSGAPQTSRTELMRMVRGGEDTYLELKVKLSNSERIAQGIVALANTGGGVIVFGVNDQLRVEGVDHPEEVQDELVRICREDIVPPLMPFIDRLAFDNGRRIVALEVQGRQRPYRTSDGKFFVRIGADKREATDDELSALLDDVRPFEFENLPALGASIGDIDEAHLWSFMRGFAGGAFDEKTVKGYPTEEILERYLLLATNSARGLVPTFAGLLLFGRDESVSRLAPNYAVTLTRFSGETSQSPIIERVELSGSLATVYEATLKFFSRYVDLWDSRPNLPRSADNQTAVPARANYQRAAVCEAVANALIHRDLALREVKTRIHIFDRAIEFVNARRSSGFASSGTRAIKFGVQQRLNPQIVSVFTNPAYGLTVPNGGVPMLLHQARAFSGRLPDIVALNDEFRLRIHGV
jgi:ATP-dependent DNA helicase RecG